MPNPKIRMFTVLLDGKKAGTLNNVKQHYKSGDASQLGQEGYIGHSDGAFLTTFSGTEVTPIAGSSFLALLKKKMLNHQDVDFTCFIGPDLHKGIGRITTMEFSSQTADGAAQGTIEIEAGKPVLIAQ